MLRDVLIRDLAIIHSLSLSFEPGFNVITGETGAGKSILLHAIGLLVGARANRSMIRSGADSLYVEGVFALDKPETAVFELQESIGIPIGDSLSVSRSMLSGGKSTARVEGQLISAAELRALGDHMLDMFGQHDRMLLEKESQIQLLDAFLEDSVRETLSEYRQLRKNAAAIRQEMQSLFTEPDERAREMDVLQYQIQELEDLGLDTLDPNAMIQAHRRYSHLEECAEYLDAMLSKIIDPAFTGLGLRSGIQELQSFAQKAELLDSEIALSETLTELEDKVNDLQYTIESYRSQCEPNPEKLAELESFMISWTKAERKYGSTKEDMLRFLENAQTRLDALQNAEFKLKALADRHREITDKMERLASQVHEERSRIAKRLGVQIQEKLRALRMEDVIFDIDVRKTEQSTENGQDEVTFYLITNKGQAMRPLHEIASGGEMSRVMLALKSLSARVRLPETIVFDEVDAGVSGLAAQSMAEELYRLSRQTQVIAVTHLPQIAAMADAHFRIQKDTTKEATFSRVSRLDTEQRENEISRLLSGSKQTEHAIAQARNLLSDAEQWKKTGGRNGLS